jgi:hypothetical protein
MVLAFTFAGLNVLLARSQRRVVEREKKSASAPKRSKKWLTRTFDEVLGLLGWSGIRPKGRERIHYWFRFWAGITCAAQLLTVTASRSCEGMRWKDNSSKLESVLNTTTGFTIRRLR